MADCAAARRDAAPTVADVLRDHAHKLRLNRQQQRVVSHIVSCRTAALGGHLGVCDTCGKDHFKYHSCRDRHCPRCGSLDQMLWAEAQSDHLLPVPYFHVVFTVPECLRPLFAGPGKAAALDALFAAASETLLDLSLSRLDAVLGVLAVLHTWTQKLDQHPHIHCLVTGGGLNGDRWIARRSFLLPLRMVRETVRGKLLQKLEVLYDSGTFDGIPYPVRHLLDDAARRKWVVYLKRPVAGPEQVVSYFARYVRRIAISNSRIVDYDGNTVTFRWRDRADGNTVRTKTLPGVVFAKKFLNHVLPPRFVRIRRYGLLSNRARRTLLPRCRQAITGSLPNSPPPREPESRADACKRIFGRDPSVCSACGVGRVVDRMPLKRDPVSAALMRSASRERGP